MVRLHGRPDRRNAGRRRSLASALAVGLAVGAGLTVVSGPATAGPSVVRDAGPVRFSTPAEPTGEPEPTSPPPTVEPPVETSAPASPSTSPSPGATTTTPVPSSGTPAATTSPTRPTQTPPVRPPAPTPTPPLSPGVRVTTGDISLPASYWEAASTLVTLRVTVTNTGTAPAGVRLAYTLPAGLTDADTDGCATAGKGEYRCGQWTAEPGARFSARLRVRVDGDAWRRMPLAGSVRVTASGAAGTATDDEGFAVLFPPGPPAPGITMSAGEVAFDADGASEGLVVRLGNTGRVDATGRVDVLLPEGITVPVPPAGCVAVATARTRCDLGPVGPGRTGELRLPVTATAQARHATPLAGAVLGRLDPDSGASRRMQLSFRITAASPEAAVLPPPAPPASLHPAASTPESGGGLTSRQRTAVLLIAVSVLLVLLVLGLATVSLRRRVRPPGTGTGEQGGPAGRSDDPIGTASRPDGGIWFQPRRPARTHERPGWDVR